MLRRIAVTMLLLAATARAQHKPMIETIPNRDVTERLEALKARLEAALQGNDTKLPLPEVVENE